MKVRVTLSIDLDTEAWENTYGPTPRPAETFAEMIRRDVREHVLNVVLGNAPIATGEVPADVTLKE